MIRFEVKVKKSPSRVSPPKDRVCLGVLRDPQQPGVLAIAHLQRKQQYRGPATLLTRAERLQLHYWKAYGGELLEWIRDLRSVSVLHTVPLTQRARAAVAGTTSDHSRAMCFNLVPAQARELADQLPVDAMLPPEVPCKYQDAS